MKLSYLIVIGLSACALALNAEEAAKGKGDAGAKKKGPATPPMTLTSTAFEDGAIIAGGRANLAGTHVDQRPDGHPKLLPAHARSRGLPQQDHG